MVFVLTINYIFTIFSFLSSGTSFPQALKKIKTTKLHDIDLVTGYLALYMCSRLLYRWVVPKSFTKIPGKHLSWSPILVNLQAAGIGVHGSCFSGNSGNF